MYGTSPFFSHATGKRVDKQQRCLTLAGIPTDRFPWKPNRKGQGKEGKNTDPLPGFLSFPGHGNQHLPSCLGVSAILIVEAAPTLSPEDDLSTCPILIPSLNK